MMPVISRPKSPLTAGTKPVPTPWALTVASQAYCGIANSWNCSASYNAARHMLKGERGQCADCRRPAAFACLWRLHACGSAVGWHRQKAPRV